MRRSATMTTGFLLILLGIQFYLVKTYTLTPKATKFWAERLADPADLIPLQTSMAPMPAPPMPNQNGQNPFMQASYPNGAYQPAPIQPQPMMSSVLLRPKQITPADWICWPVIFVGAVLCLGGITRRG